MKKLAVSLLCCLMFSMTAEAQPIETTNLEGQVRKAETVFGSGCAGIVKEVYAATSKKAIKKYQKKKRKEEEKRKKEEEKKRAEENKCEFVLGSQDLDVLEHIVMHESGNTESDYGVALVADCVLNRVKSKTFPNTVTAVVSQRGQFCWGRELYRYTPTDRVKKIVAQECKKRTNTSVVFFSSANYLSCGRPAFKVGHHYFSTEK